MLKTCLRMFWVVLLLMAASCTDGEKKREEPGLEPGPVGTPTSPPIRATVGPSGGDVQSADGRLALHIPEGAVSSDVEFSIQPITNETPGGVGQAYRLGPAGMTFDRPVQVSFAYDEADLLGTAPELLLAATQDADGFWLAFREATLDTSAGTLSISTSHFSDYSLLAGAQIKPSQAKVKVGESVSLQISHCVRQKKDDTADLVAKCEQATDDDVLLYVSDWSVNSVSGGNGAHGTVESMGPTSALYVAPSEVPGSNPVQVTAQMDAELVKVLLVAEIEVEEEEEEPQALACLMRCDPGAIPGPLRGSCEGKMGGSNSCTEYTGTSETIEGLSVAAYCEVGGAEYRPHSCEGEFYQFSDTGCLTCCGTEKENITYLITTNWNVYSKGVEGAKQWWQDQCIAKGGVMVE